jgi:tRNA threonylcarbamoyladenosine biosynthesis protein TsaB
VALAAEPLVLAFDATGFACSVAVAAGETVLARDRLATRYGQAERLLPMIDDVIRRASLLPSAIDLIGTTVGPGSFTGIRVSLSAARGIALATRARLIGVSGFEAVAANLARPIARTPGYLLIALESRREDFYIQIFDRAGGSLSEPRTVMPALLGAVLDESIGEAPVFVAGDAAERAAGALSRRPGTTVIGASAPDAGGVLRAVRRRWRAGERGGKPLPLYLRAPDVTLPTSRQGVRGANRRIEPISPVMAGAVSMLHGACFHEDPWDTPAIIGIMGIPGFFGWIAWEDEQPIGFALAFDLGEECEILSLGVLPGRRRAGCASALLASACAEAKQRKARSVVLEVAADNKAARGLYAARGFVSVGYRPNYYRRGGRRADALILRLSLAGA